MASTHRISLASARYDSRVDTRVEPPPCPKCGMATTDFATRTEDAVYLRCHLCSHVWCVAGPSSSDGTNGSLDDATRGIP